MSRGPAERAVNGREGSLVRHRDFVRLWSAETVSQFGTQVTMLAIPLAAVLVLDATTFEVGLLRTVEFLPFILVGLPAGVWVDRWRRRPVLVAGDLGRAIALATVPIAYLLGVLTMLQLYGVVLVTGVLTVFFDVAYMSYLPSLVERDQLVDGNGKLEISRSGAQLGGPGLAGLLVELFSAPVAILADAVSFVGSALFVLRIRKREPAPAPAPVDGHPSIRSEIAAGLRYVLHHPCLRWIAACTAISNFFAAMVDAVFVVYAVRQLDLSAGRIGFIYAAGNVGYVLGAALVGRINRRFRLGRTIVATAFIFGPAGALFPLAPQAAPEPLLIAGWFLFSSAGVVYNVSQVSYRQAITPNEMLGRMNATMRFIVWGTMPLGSLVGGIVGASMGLRPALWLAAVGGATSVLPVALSPVRRLTRIPQPEDEAPAPEPLTPALG